MTPAKEQDPRIFHVAESQEELFLPRLDSRAFWTAEHHLGRSQITSTIIHGSFAALLVLLPYFYQQVMPNPKMNPPPIFITPLHEIGIYLTPQAGASPQIPHGGGSGGGGEKEPDTKGMLRFGPTQILPPHLQSNPNAALQVPANLVGDPSLNASMVQMPNWGDPAALAFNNSNGRGDGDGMGDKRGSGVGDQGGPGPGYGPGTDGNIGGKAYLQGGYVVGDPVCAFCPRPEYSDEARKAKYQGQVLLSVVVLANGQAGKIQVVNSPGLGLDQKAIEAVRTWRFKPAIGRDGKPVATTVTIQVMFQLF